jgi:hypothetical protein
MPHSVLEAVKMGIWDFELEEKPKTDFQATDAIPGSSEKLDILAQRIQLGLPLWHPNDRLNYDKVGSKED